MADYVYIARSSLRPGLVKIGWTRRPRERMQALQAEARLLLVVASEPRRSAYWSNGRLVERALHERFDHLRIRAAGSRRHDQEWFSAEDELARFG